MHQGSVHLGSCGTVGIVVHSPSPTESVFGPMDRRTTSRVLAYRSPRSHADLLSQVDGTRGREHHGSRHRLLSIESSSLLWWMRFSSSELHQYAQRQLLSQCSLRMVSSTHRGMRTCTLPGAVAARVVRSTRSPVREAHLSYDPHFIIHPFVPRATPDGSSSIRWSTPCFSNES